MPLFFRKKSAFVGALSPAFFPQKKSGKKAPLLCRFFSAFVEAALFRFFVWFSSGAFFRPKSRANLGRALPDLFCAFRVAFFALSRAVFFFAVL